MGRSAATQELLIRFRTDILLGVYGMSDPVRELALAEKYGISRAYVRNALVQLEREGLIRALPNGTKCVARPTLKDIQDLYDLRLYLEQQAVSQLLAQEERKLGPLYSVMEQVTEAKGLRVEEVLGIDSRFHRTVILCSENKALLQAWDTMAEVMQAIFRLNMTESDAYRQWFADTFVQRHKGLFLSLAGEDSEAVRQFGEHIRDAREISGKAMRKAFQNAGERAP